MNTKDTLGRTPLHRAAQRPSQPLMKCFIDQGADIFIQDRDQKTPFDYAPQCTGWMKDSRIVYLKKQHTTDQTTNQQLHKKIEQQSVKLTNLIQLTQQKNKQMQNLQDKNTNLKNEIASLKKVIELLKTNQSSQPAKITYQKHQDIKLEEKQSLLQGMQLFAPPQPQLSIKLKKAIDMALNAALKNKDFKALTPYLTKESASYIQKTVFTAEWIQQFVAPNPDHYYSNDVIPHVTIHGSEVVVKNSKSGHGKFVWKFDVRVKYDVVKQIWCNEEIEDIRFKRHRYPSGNIVWTNMLYYKPGYYIGLYAKDLRYTEEEVYKHDSYERYSKGVTGAEWVGTKSRGLVKMSTALCDLSVTLQKLETPSPSDQSHSKFNSK